MKTGLRAAVVLAAASGASAVTPVQKVVDLLKDLQVTVEKQGQKEAIQYDKFACFCKSQAGFKKGSINKSGGKIKVLKADIKDENAKIKALNSDVSDLGGAIAALKTDIATNNEKRAKDHKGYLAKAKDLNEAIASCDEAIGALKDSKKSMSGADLDLAQLKKTALSMEAGTADAMEEAVSLVRTASKAAHDETADKPGDASKFKYQSNDIIATIQGLQRTFKTNKKELDMDEADAALLHNKKVLGMTNEKTFKNKEKKEKEVLAQMKTEEKTDDEQSKDGESKDKKGDENFLKTLVSNCETKAKEWDQRSTARASEMSALAEATATLEKGALSRYSVNKKLVGLVNVSPKDTVKEVAAPAPIAKEAVKVAPKAKKAKSFLQFRTVGGSQEAAIKRLLSNLDSAATRLRSPILAAIALKVQLKEDHFSNVRALIKDLMNKLKSDAKAEGTTKSFCDAEMKKAVSNRDKSALDIEEQNGIIAKKSSLAAAKTEEIEDLSKQVAELNKDILEAEELRKSEKTDNMQSVGESKAGAAAVKSALTTLKGFYKSALLQADYKPKNSDRNGKTVGNTAPETFSGEYKGEGAAAKGILGILEVIQSDFERTVAETEKSETKSADEHKQFLSASNKDIKAKSQNKVDAQKAKEGAEQAIVQAKDDLNDGQKLRDSAGAVLQKLQPMCVAGEETYEERVAKRKEEITALREAMTILDDWQK